jgi:hypothetical protein
MILFMAMLFIHLALLSALFSIVCHYSILVVPLSATGDGAWENIRAFTKSHNFVTISAAIL